MEKTGAFREIRGTWLAQVQAVEMAVVPVAFVMTSFDPGGTERQMIELMRRLDRRRWAVHLVCTRRSGSWFARAAEHAESVAEFPISSFKRTATLRAMGALASWFRTRDIGVVHTADLYANIFGLPAAAAAGVPARIANRREINPDKSVVQIAVQRAAYSCAHRIVANSQAVLARLAREGVSRRRVRIVPNGIDTNAFTARPPRQSLRRILTVANLRGEKGHDVLIDAAPRLLERFPDLRFAIAGSGPLHEALIARTRARGVDRAFTFLGHCDEVSLQLAAADLFVLPSRSEAFPNALLEAMASGLPVAASRVGGISELVDHERTGLLVPPGDALALGDAIGRLLTNPRLAASVGSAARACVHERYSFDRMVGAFDQIYADVLRARGILNRGPEALAAPASHAVGS